MAPGWIAEKTSIGAQHEYPLAGGRKDVAGGIDGQAVRAAEAADGAWRRTAPAAHPAGRMSRHRKGEPAVIPRVSEQPAAVLAEQQPSLRIEGKAVGAKLLRAGAFPALRSERDFVVEVGRWTGGIGAAVADTAAPTTAGGCI